MVRASIFGNAYTPCNQKICSFLFLFLFSFLFFFFLFFPLQKEKKERKQERKRENEERSKEERKKEWMNEWLSRLSYSPTVFYSSHFNQTCDISNGHRQYRLSVLWQSLDWYLFILCHSCFSVSVILLIHFQRSLPGNYTSGPLGVDEVEAVTKTWKYASFFPTLAKYIRENIQNKTLASLGVRQKTTGQLVGWMLEREDGSLGMLHVHPDHRGRGIGAVLIQRLSGEILTQREAVYVDIEPDNIKPVKLYERCGYEIDSAQMTWISFKPQWYRSFTMDTTTRTWLNRYIISLCDSFGYIGSHIQSRHDEFTWRSLD